MEYEFLYNGASHVVSVEKAQGCFKVKVGEKVFDVDASLLSPGLLSMIIGGRSVRAYGARRDGERVVCIGGVQWVLGDPAAEENVKGSGIGGTGNGMITTPMPGKIVTIHVKVGDVVKKQQPLVVLEAMKMQNDICADVDGVVKKIHFAAGDQASFGDPLVEIEMEG
ncbi:MAG: biotin/lipoyl-binding protein [bacterium]